MTNFVSLHNQTDYSILDSLASVKSLFAKAKQLNQPALAITDHGTLAATWEAFKVSKDTGVKLIIGCECYFQDDNLHPEDKFRHLVLLATNAVGYKNLLTIVKKGFDHNSFESKRVYSVIDWKLLQEYSEGLICLTACGNGIISQLLTKGKFDEAEKSLLKLKDIFQDKLGVEIQPNNMKRGSNIYNDEIDQQFLNRRLIDLAKKHNIKVVAACNTHYINKEDHDIHDVLLAIGSHQPIYSNFRLKYPVPDFYLKSADDVKNFFSRNYGEEFATQICENTIYFADMCEIPNWIDPKYSNPSGKELPIFPVKDELDYPQFLQWSSSQPEFVQQLSEDKQYLRFVCENKFPRIKFSSDEEKATYLDRINEELDVLEYHGFSSYMLIVADYVNWARKNNIPVGEGRGCLTGDTQVLTDKGFKLLQDISTNDQVFSHTGNIKPVLKTFKFDVAKETLLKISSYQSFNDLVMTRDHKVLAATPNYADKQYVYGNKIINRKVKVFNPELNWVEARKLKQGDYLFTPTLNREIITPGVIDLAKYSDFEVKGDRILKKVYYQSDLSIKSIAKKSGLSFECVRSYKNNQEISNQNLNTLTSYLSSVNSSTEEFLSNQNFKINNIQRYIPVDIDFTYILGRWIGDGCFSSSPGISICFNSKDINGIEKVKSYFNKLGFHVSHENRVRNNVLLTISNKELMLLFKDLFPNYTCAYNKHIPSMFRNFPPELIKSLLLGIMESDGCVYNNYEKIKTTSLQLALEIKEALNYISLPSTIYTEKNPKRYDVPTATSYSVMFYGIKTPLNKKNIIITPSGFYSKITKISTTKRKYVYDFTVKDDHSYLTSSGIVHNSVGGSLIAYLLGIHQADPIKYNLIFARFHNKEKSSFPDIDLDFAPSGREKVQNYLRHKYGDDHVAHVSNVNTITPKVYVRDISRACELGGSREEAIKLGNDVADCIPSDIHSIDDAYEKVPLFAEYCKKYPEFLKYKDICGKYRAWSTHAGGIIISARPLTGLVPLRRDKDGALALEYDKEKAEENGLVKMDTLGLSTLDIIGETYRLIKEQGKPLPPDDLNYEEYDEKTYDLISKGDTFAVFQFGTSGGTVDLCKRIKPKTVDDLANINALARPSARDMRDDFIKVKDGKKPMALLHPNLKRAFNDTYGFGLYEECLMYLAQDVAGWNLHSADRLRKLTKEKGKNPKKAQQWKMEFIEDSVKNGVNEEIAKRIWSEVIELFQGYGFNKSLSVFELIDIYTIDGQFLESKPIVDVKPGDYVRSRDEKTQKEIFVEVLDNHDHGVLPLVEVELDSGEKVKCTMDHKFRVQETGDMLPLWQILRDNLSIVVKENNV